jgi:hypothetical protein
MRSFEVGSSTSRTADAAVRGDPCFISCGVIASDPYRRQKGVNPVTLHSVVFSAQTTSGNWSGHLPFLSSRSIFLTAVKFLPLATNNILPKEFLGCLGCDSGYCPRFNPFGEVFTGDEGELEVLLGLCFGAEGLQGRSGLKCVSRYLRTRIRKGKAAKVDTAPKL